MKKDVREFYDEIGWHLEEDGQYQNAHYEDLREVSREYIHQCHLRVKRHLLPDGKFLLDLGSGPIQYDEYLTYSEDYEYRVCADISITAMQEARKKIGGHGMFVVVDAANLPFKSNAFDGFVTLHTIHHLPEEEHEKTYLRLNDVLRTGRAGVVVNGWVYSPLMNIFRWFTELKKTLWLIGRRLMGRPVEQRQKKNKVDRSGKTKGTFVQKHSLKWFKHTIAPKLNTTIFVWRSASVHFLKHYLPDSPRGRKVLDFLYRMEERYPKFFGERGTYPLIVIRK